MFWVEVGPECNVVHNYAYFNLILILRFYGSINCLKPRMYWITLQNSSAFLTYVIVFLFLSAYMVIEHFIMNKNYTAKVDSALL